MINDGEIFTFGRCRVIVKQRELMVDSKAVSLGGRAFDILLILLRNPGELVSRDALSAAVWSGAYVEDNTLTAQLSALRHALKDGDGGLRYIRTVPGRGYCFVAPVVTTKCDGEYDMDRHSSPWPNATMAKPARSALTAATAFLLLAILAGGVLWQRGVAMPSRPRPPPWSAEDYRLSFVLKPFVAPQSDAELSAYAEALRRSLADRLMSTRDNIRLIRFEDQAANGATPHGPAHFIIDAVVFRHDGHPGATASVEDAATAEVLKTITVDDPPSEPRRSDRPAVAKLSNIIASAAAAREIRQSAARLPDRRDAWDWVLLADGGAAGKEGTDRAVTDLERALKLAPDDPHVLGPYALALAHRAASGWNANNLADLATSKAVAERLLLVDVRNRDALSTLCLDLATQARWLDVVAMADRMLLDNRYDRAALAAKSYGLLALDRIAAAEETLAIMLEDDGQTNAPSAYETAGLINFALGRNDEAARYFRSAILAMSAEDLGIPAHAGLRLYLASAEALLGHADAAAQALSDFHDAVPQIRGIAEFQHWSDPIRLLPVAPERFAQGLRLAGMAE